MNVARVMSVEFAVAQFEPTRQPTGEFGRVRDDDERDALFLVQLDEQLAETGGVAWSSAPVGSSASKVLVDDQRAGRRRHAGIRRRKVGRAGASAGFSSQTRSSNRSARSRAPARGDPAMSESKHFPARCIAEEVVELEDETDFTVTHGGERRFVERAKLPALQHSRGRWSARRACR